MSELIQLNTPASVAVVGGTYAHLASGIHVPAGSRLVGSVRASKALTMSVYQNPVNISGARVYLDKTNVSIDASEDEGGGTKIDVSITGPDMQITFTNGGTPSTDDTVAYASLFAKRVPSDVSTAALTATDIPTAVDAAKIANGSVSNTEFQYVNGVTSAIQTQMDTKIPFPASTAAGDILYATGASTYARLAKGTAGQVLTMNAGATAPEWATP
jgi:hypothetical protein